MSQKDFSKQVGVSESYVSQICQGKKIPTVSMLLHFSRCLNVPVQIFFEEPPENRPDADEPDLVEMYCALGPQGREDFEGWIRRRAGEWMAQYTANRHNKACRE